MGELVAALKVAGLTLCCALTVFLPLALLFWF